MASSSSSGSQRRKPLAKRQPLSRHNSSFLGSLKSLVTAPLAWFASTDDFEDSKDFQGKRRRLVGAPAEPIVGNDERSSRTKRMRIHSPPRDEPYSQPSASGHGYLDPPGSAFQQQHRQSSPLIQHTVTRSLSVNQPYDFNNINNHYRASTLPRTMSIDPPLRPLSNASVMASISLYRDTSIDSSNLTKTVPRDLSMPPLSSRPSFLMRTSMTPQPFPLREVSEPPALNTLSARPAFLHAPPMKSLESMDGLSGPSSSATLGSLVDSVRNVRSPTRQHSSLVLGEINGEHPNPSPHPETVIEKALHELDIYKTPLVPTRLRSSNIPPTASSSNMFKSRRSSKLVLMQSDNRPDRLGRKVSGKEAPLANETKPYAGEGGMKKLLARRKQEANEEDDDPIDDDEMVDDPTNRHGKSVDNSQNVSASLVPLPSPQPKSDWFSAKASSSTQSSSLRVGRTKTRNHIARPTRPSRTKFSAAFDDDVMDDGDELDEEALQRKKEREALEEAAKHVPAFKIPKGFTFAKETKPAEVVDTSDAKEPPIKSLPFSLTKPTAPEIPPTQQSSNLFSSLAQSSGPSAFGTSFLLPSAPAPSLGTTVPPRAPSPFLQAQTAQTPPQASNPVTASTTMPAVANGVPNFFASSSVLAKPLEQPQPTNRVPNFFATSPVSSKPLHIPPPAPLTFNIPNAGSANPSVPVKDAENPLWEGENNKAAQFTSGSSLFGNISGSVNGFSMSVKPEGLGNSESAQPATSNPSLSLFSAEKLAESVPAPAQSTLFGGTPTATPGFSFSKPAELSAPDVSDKSTPKTPLMFGPSPASTTPMPTSGFPVSSTLFTQPPKPESAAPSTLFGTTPTPSAPFGELPKATSVVSSLFTLGTPAPTTIEPSKPSLGTVEVPKPHFGSGGSNGFSFGEAGRKDSEQKTTSATSSFSFGATSSTSAPAETKRSTPFTFGASPTTAPAPAPVLGFSFSSGNNNASELSAKPPAPAMGFSFSGGGTNASEISAKPFSFGQSSTITRPSTPPKLQEQEISMDESPTRDTQQTIKFADRPTIGGNGFSFGNPAPAPTFGAQSNGSSSFAFGASSTMTNTFGTPSDSNPFSFGQAAPISSTFNFGQNKAESEPPRPSTTGSFSFGTPSSTTGPAPAPVFPFGGTGNTSTGSTFGQSQSGSAPSSPSTFAQQSSPFSFGAPLPPVNTAFSFGSQPASPAGVNVSLPRPGTPGGFGQAQPSSPFGAPSPAATTSGALFTIGAAPAAAPAAPGTRTIRKLPNRRGGAKR